LANLAYNSYRFDCSRVDGLKQLKKMLFLQFTAIVTSVVTVEHNNL